jgi:hypothetical protein
MFQAFYIVTKDCWGSNTHPEGWEGPIKAGTVVALVYFDEIGMEFWTGEKTERGEPIEFRLQKPCPVEAAATCPYCGKIVSVMGLTIHGVTDKNCIRIREAKGEGHGKG